MALVPATKNPGREVPGTAAVDNHADIQLPLDFCFMNITDSLDLIGEEPRGHMPEKFDEDKYETKCLRLPHNVIQDLKTLPETLPKLLVDPDCLRWLDLSHNELTIIDPVLCEIPQLSILYLHGNQINNIAEVDKLGGIPTLTKLTLHGNPIDTVKNYRFYVLSRVKTLRNFDFSAITKGDRATMATWEKFNPQRKKRAARED